MMGTMPPSKSVEARIAERAPKILSYHFLLWKKSVNYLYHSDVEDINCPTFQTIILTVDYID